MVHYIPIPTNQVAASLFRLGTQTDTIKLPKPTSLSDNQATQCKREQFKPA